MARISIAPCLAVMLCGAASAQTQLFRFQGSGSDAFGRAVAIAGDLDGDGYADVVVGASQGDDSTGTGKGFAQVLSGKNGAILHTFTGR
ncbi:MAG: integrin alpha [Planctomycetota bacterium]